ncbi:uncharacterized protein LOC126841545 [Adelges cooleyi]|uniref:uncharacterized protein LOC126841545 n=1 Tax=Adelges cooleyi TaxID=133065 RepID=UPI0021808934|nr:uncharacterized protein LOC126841545 [Adelges cooleyi]
MRELFDTIRPIIVCQLGTSTCILICFTYAYVANYFNGMSIMSVLLMKHFFSLMFGVLRLFILTKFCGLVDDQVNSMNFSLYSCNWLDQDLSFQKLLLLTMSVNSANMKTFTITPTKKVDLKMFASTIQTSYTIISVLLKKNLSKQN